jgi:hypothetical protein
MDDRVDAQLDVVAMATMFHHLSGQKKGGCFTVNYTLNFGANVHQERWLLHDWDVVSIFLTTA